MPDADPRTDPCSDLRPDPRPDPGADPGRDAGPGRAGSRGWAPVGRPLRVVQVGLGGWGRSWAETVLPGTPDLRVVAWADPDPGRRASFRARWPDAPERSVHPSLAAALGARGPDGEQPDAVLVTAGIAAHASLAREALDAGLHVLVEKPFTTDLATASDLVRVAERAGRAVVVAQNYRYVPAVMAVRALLRDRVVGRVQHVDVRFRRDHAHPSPAPGAAGWPDTSVLFQIAVHHADLLRALLGTEVAAVTARPWAHGQVEGHTLSAFSALVELADGTSVDLSLSWASRAGPTPWTGVWRIEGERGELRWWGRDPGGEGCGVEVRDDGGRVTRPDVVVPEVHDRAAVVAELVRVVRTGGTSEIDGAHNLGTVAFLDACARSLATGERRAVDLGGLPTLRGPASGVQRLDRDAR